MVDRTSYLLVNETLYQTRLFLATASAFLGKYVLPRNALDLYVYVQSFRTSVSWVTPRKWHRYRVKCLLSPPKRAER